MKKVLSTKYSAGAFNFAMLILRIAAGVLLMNHGYGKLVHFNETAQHMPSLFGMSSSVTAALVVFAEFFCALFIIIGLFTRFATIPVIIAMGYALIVAHKGQAFGDGEKAALYLAMYFVLLLTGAGRASIDSLISK